MASFLYKAYDSSGAKVDGQLEAKDQQAAIEQLNLKGLHPINVVEESDGDSLSSYFQRGISLADIEFLTAELSLLLESGVRIDKGIDIIRRTKAKPSLAKLLRSISYDLKKGISLSEAFRAHEKVFDPLYCNLIELGEASGNLSEVFASLAKDLKFKRELRNKIMSALAYPMVIFFVCLLSIYFIFSFIIPRMSGMFDNVETIPWYTNALLSSSEWLNNNQGLLLISIVAVVAMITSLSTQQSFIIWWQKTALKLPVIGQSILTVERIRFNSGLAMMIKAGVQVDRAIELSGGSLKNHVVKRELEIAKSKVKVGSALTPALKQTSLYPDFYISLIEVGEESGNLARVFDEIANRSRTDFESWTQRLTTLIEPLMILFMGGFVGGVVVVMLMSMVSVNDFGI